MTNNKNKKLKRKLKELQRRYPNNKYEINDNYQIIRTGRRPHKISKKEKITCAEVDVRQTI